MLVKYLISFIVFRLQQGNNCLAATITFYIENKNETQLNYKSHILENSKPNIDVLKPDVIYIENDNQKNHSIHPPDFFKYLNIAEEESKYDKPKHFYNSKAIETMPEIEFYKNSTGNEQFTYPNGFQFSNTQTKIMFDENIAQESKRNKDLEHLSDTHPVELVDYNNKSKEDENIKHIQEDSKFTNYNTENQTDARSKIIEFRDTTEDFLQDSVIRLNGQNNTDFDQIIIQSSANPYEFYEPEYMFVPDLPRKSRQLSNDTGNGLQDTIKERPFDVDEPRKEINTTEKNKRTSSDIVIKNETVSSSSNADQSFKAKVFYNNRSKGPVFVGKTRDISDESDMSYGGDPIPLSSESVPVFEKCCKCVTKTTTLATPILGKMADDCACRSRSADEDMAFGSSNIFQNFAKNIALPSSLPAASPTPILKPEVGFATSLFDTLRTASEVELKNAKDREAARALEELKKKSDEEQEKLKSDKGSKISPALKLTLPGKLSAPRPVLSRPTVINSRNNFGDSDFAGSENVPSVIVQPDYLMGRPGAIGRGVPGPIYIGLPTARRPMLSRVSSSPLRMSTKGIALAKPSSPVLSSIARRPLQGTSSRTAGSILGSAASTKAEVPEDRSRRLLTAIRDALGLDKNHEYKCKIIINEN